MKQLKWLDENLEEILLILLLICMVCIMGLQVFARYALNNSLSWSEELTQYMFVWATFLSISYCVKKRISIKIEQFINVLPEKGKTLLRLMRHTLVFFFCLIMLPYCVTYVQQAISFQATSAALGIPMYYIQSAPLVGFCLLTIRVIQAWWREAKNMFKKAETQSSAPAPAKEPQPTKTESTVMIIEANLASHEPEAAIIEETLEEIDPDIDLHTLKRYDPPRPKHMQATEAAKANEAEKEGGEKA